jgi:two-component system chemotaxis sensor kinase CheA
MSSLDPVAVFRTEAAECLEAIEAGLLDLTHKLDDKDVVDAVFRGLHTLKGSGSMFGFDALAAFTHHCETAFDRVRKGEVPATAELVAAVLAAQDHMRALVDRPDADHGDTGQQLLAQLQAAVGGTSAGQDTASALAPVATAAPVAAKTTTRRIRFSLPSNSMERESRSFGHSIARRHRADGPLRDLGGDPHQHAGSLGDRRRVHLRDGRHGA